MFDTVLVVCVGNICRSPTGERLLQKYLPGKNIISAGLSPLLNKPADELACHVANDNKLSLADHHAKKVTADLCHEYDLILVMERKHIDRLCKIAPEARGKIMLFGHWLQQTEIPDPYKQSRKTFEYVYHLLDESAQQWAKALNR
ncbi:protein tyrosine phosphatase [Sodalis sp. RH21]|uniref:arsenate reductase/protein-tyrosine-phosphatase family protein n=1 Tax=unclassified Sodalis (in: enterobacteria) TaxID=2636512 RepID=UPI0039B68919